MKYKLYISSIVLFLLSSYCLIAQTDKKINNYSLDSTSRITSEEDTSYINNQKKYDEFYESLQNKASKNKITKAAIDLLLVNQPTSGKFIGIENIRNEEYFELYSGKKIRKIEVLKLDVFGPTIHNPLRKANNWFQNAGNKTHIKTHDFIIKNNLFFEENDLVDPAQLVDNERHLRELDYIKDASIEIVEVNGSDEYVDILIVTKDVYSAGLSIDVNDAQSGTFEIYENNIAGIGHRFQTSIYWSSIEDVPFGYGFKYRIGNIGHSFIQTNLEYNKSFFTEKYGLSFRRRFVSYNTKWAGHLSAYKTNTRSNIRKTDTVLLNEKLDYITQDFWLGRSFLVNKNNKKFKNRSKIVLGFRYIYNKFLEGPEVNERYNFQYHNNQIAIAGIAFARQKHIESSLIYGFGKTEDIPIGLLTQFNLGFEKDEFYKRTYVGGKLSNGIYNPSLGYLNFNAEIGGYYFRKDFEQGAIKINTQAISNLFYYNNIKLRNFLRINYIYGISRYPDEQLYFSDRDIWGLESNLLYGMEKLSFNTELVAYSKLHIYNFNFIFFGFGDMGLIGPTSDNIFRQKLYSGLGLGLRVRNENLVFKTFQIRFAFYPFVPGDVNTFNFILSGENYEKFTNYEPTAPNTIEYR